MLGFTEIIKPPEHMQVPAIVMLRGTIDLYQREWFNHLLQAQALAGQCKTTCITAPVSQTIVGANIKINGEIALELPHPAATILPSTTLSILTGANLTQRSTHLALITDLPRAHMSSNHVLLTVAAFAMRYAGLHIAMTHSEWMEYAENVPWDDLRQTFNEYDFSIAHVTAEELTHFNQKYLSTIPLVLTRHSRSTAGDLYWLSTCQLIKSVTEATADQVIAAHEQRLRRPAPGRRAQRKSQTDPDPAVEDAMTVLENSSSTVGAVKEQQSSPIVISDAMDGQSECYSSHYISGNDSDSVSSGENDDEGVEMSAPAAEHSYSRPIVIDFVAGEDTQINCNEMN